MKRIVPPCWIWLLVVLVLTPRPDLRAAIDNSPDCEAVSEPEDEDGEELYMQACATCHGIDGKGVPASRLGFETPPADFTDCNFATREPDADWIAVAHQGGPVRGFAREMPAFGDALTEEELEAILAFIRTLCEEDEWPRGELNLPRPLITTKAFPEDEAVLSTTWDVEGALAISSEIEYEKRLGARGQLELVVPYGVEKGSGRGHLGNATLGYKRVLLQSLESGSIFSAGAEFILPTGPSEDDPVVFEPFASFGQGLAADFFLQFQGGAELPIDDGEVTREFFARGVLGKTITEGRWGRSWSPMIEILGARIVDPNATSFSLALVPQVQVSLNQRQHVMLNVGVMIPSYGEDEPVRFALYLLWEWFDGGFFEGW